MAAATVARLVCGVLAKAVRAVLSAAPQPESAAAVSNVNAAARNGILRLAAGGRAKRLVPIGPWELVIILVIVVVIFGAGRLSQVGGALGKSVREFRSAVHEEHQPANAALSSPAAAAVAAPEVKCPSCDASNAAGQKFCGKCGTPLSSTQPTSIENTCPSCATVNPPGQVFCGQCGTRLSRAA
jgi:sec-independent protein translocase protein TatA